MRWTILAASVSIALTGLSAFAAEPTPPLFTSWPSGEQLNDWIDQYIDEGGWAFIDAGDDSAAFLATSGKDRSTYPLLNGWIRWERFLETPKRPARSELWQVEVNCKDRTQKTLQTKYFASNNTMGEVVRSWTAPSYTAPRNVRTGSMAEAILDAICSAPDGGEI